MTSEIGLIIKKILNGYILTLDSGNIQYFKELDDLLNRIKEESEMLLHD